MSTNNSSYVSAEERQVAWNEGKLMASDAVQTRKDALDNAALMRVPPPNDLPPEVQATRKRTIVFSDLQPNGGMSEAARIVSQRQESKRSKVFKELHYLRLDQSHFITYKLMNNGPVRQMLEHIFRIACSHGVDLEDAKMSRKNFKIFMEQFGVTTQSPYDQFEPRSTLIIRDKSGPEDRADEVQLLRFGYENVDMLFEYGLDRIGRIVVTALGSSPDFDENQHSPSQQQAAPFMKRNDERLTFHEFLLCMVECVHRMIPPDYYPPLESKADVHIVILETFVFHMFGKPYVTKQIPTSFDDFSMVETMAEVMGNAYDVLADVFLFCIAPTKYEEWTDQERHDRYIRIVCGDACIEYESLMEVIKKFRMPLNLLASEPTYELFCRYDVGTKQERAVIDFQGFTLVCAHIAFTLYLTNAAYPTPQSKFQRLIEQYVLPSFPRRLTIPPPFSATKMVVLEGIKPERAVVGTELWVFGQDFPIRATQNGHRCPLYVRFNEVIAKGTCMSASVGNVIVPRLPTTPDTITQVSLADGEEPGTFVVKLEAKTVAIVLISNDRLRWTAAQTARLSFEDVLATYVIPNEMVQTMKLLFQAFGEKGPDYELNGNLLPGPTYLNVVNWSKICQSLPMCIFDDGDPSQFATRHLKFFESARTRSDAIDITVPVITFPEMVNVIFKQFIAHHGPDERLIDAVGEALQNANAAIEQQLLDSRPKRSNTAMGAARLAEYQKILSQVHGSIVREGNCVNCGQDPSVRAGENPFIDLEMLKRPALKKKEENAPDMIFSRSIAAFSDQLPKDPAADEITESEFTKMTIEQADMLSGRGKYYFLNNLVQRLIDRHEEDFQALELRFSRAIEKSRTHGRYVTMQVLLLQQTLESISDGLSRVGAIVIEHENLVIQERKARLNGFVTQSDTAYAMTTQLYQGLKASINTVRDMTRSFVSDDDPDKFDVKYMFEEAVTYKQHLMQQTLQLESAVKLRLDEIRCGPEISAEGLVRKKYMTGAGEEDDENPEQAALRRQASQAGADLLRRQSSMGRREQGVSEEDVQKRLLSQQEMMETAFELKIKEAEKKKDQIIRESTLLLEGLLGHVQEYVDIPGPLANPCFRFLHDRGSTLKRSIREGYKSPTSPSENDGGYGRRPFVLTDEIAVQSDEDNFPSMLAMQQDLLARGLVNGAKLGGPAVLLRKALTYAKEVLGKYSSNATIFSELSKILKLEMQNVMNPRTRDLVSLPSSEVEMYSRDSVVNTQLTFSDFDYVESYVKHQIQLEDLVTLTNVAKEEAAAAAAKANKRGAMGRRADTKVKPSVDLPISPNTAALAAHPQEMMGLISLDSVLPLETRVERRLLERNAKLVHALRAPAEMRCKTTETAPLPRRADASSQAELRVEHVADDEDAVEQSTKKKSRKKDKEKDKPPSREERSTLSTPSTKPPKASTPARSTHTPSPTQSVKAKLKVEKTEETTNSPTTVVPSGALDEALTDAEAYAALPSVAAQLEGDSASPGVGDDVRPAENKNREKVRSRAAPLSFDVPGPSMSSGVPKTVPHSQLSTGQTTEGLMHEKWNEIVSPREDRVALTNNSPGNDRADGGESTSADDDDAALSDPSAALRVVANKLRKSPAVSSGTVSPQNSGSDPSSDAEDSDSEDGDHEGTSQSQARVQIGYVEEEFIPDIPLMSAEAKAHREAQTREIEASTARLTAAIDEAMKNAPDLAAVHIELNGMTSLASQLRAKVLALETELETRLDQNNSLKETVSELKRLTVQGLDGKNVVMRNVKSTVPSVSHQQVEAARSILSEKAVVRNRVARIIRKYGFIASAAVQQQFEDSAGSTASSGLLELEELLENVLALSKEAAQVPPRSPNRQTDYASGVASLPEALRMRKGHSDDQRVDLDASSVVEDCHRMIRVHFQDEVGSSGAIQSLIENDPLSVIPILARALINSWQKRSVETLVDAATADDEQNTGNGGSRRPSLQAASSFFASMLNQGDGHLSDADIRSASETAHQLRCSSPASKERVMFMINQHEVSLQEYSKYSSAAPKPHILSPVSSSTFSNAREPQAPPGMMCNTVHVPPVQLPREEFTSANVHDSGEEWKPAGDLMSSKSSSFSKKFPCGDGRAQQAMVPRLSFLFPKHHFKEAASVTSSQAPSPQMLLSPSSSSKPPSQHACTQTAERVPTSTVEAQTEALQPYSPVDSNDSMYHVGSGMQALDDDDDDEEFDYATYYPVSVPAESSNVPDRENVSENPVAPKDQSLHQVTFHSASMQTEAIRRRTVAKNDAAIQSDGCVRCSFTPSQPWHEQLSNLFSALLRNNIDDARTHESALNQWLLGTYHCLRSNMAPNLEFVAKQLAELKIAAKVAKEQISDIPSALLQATISSIESLDASCGGPLARFIDAHAGLNLQWAAVSKDASHKVEFDEVNVLITNLMQHIDHRISGPRAHHVMHSQRSLNRWRTHVLLTLLDTLEPELQPCFPTNQRLAMTHLVEFEELSTAQQRRLFFLQVTALSLIIFSHCSRRNYVSLAHAANVQDSPLPLSLQASSTSYIRMVRDCLLGKIVPDAVNDVGLKPMSDLSWMSKQFVSKILGFSREELLWLVALPKAQCSEADQHRISDLLEVTDRAKKWNPAPHELSTLEWIEIMRSTLVLLLGSGGRTVPSFLGDLTTLSSVAPKVLPRKPSVAATTSQATIVVDEPVAQQPSSLHEPPSFLRDVQWAKPASTSSYAKVKGSNQHHVPLKCETPPPSFGKASSFTSATPGKLNQVRSMSVTPSTTAPSAYVSGAHGGSSLGQNTLQSFSAASATSVVGALMQGSGLNTVRPLSIPEQRELHDLREICAGIASTGVAPLRSYRAWLDLEVRQRVAELRSVDLDCAPSSSALQEAISRALRSVGAPASSWSSSNVTSTLAQLTGAQTRMFIQVLRGEDLRGGRLPAMQ